MFEAIGKAISGAKDRALEASAKAFLQGKLKNFGHVTQLQMDTRNRKASITMALKGETSPVTVEVQEYELVQRGGAVWIRVLRAAASREWMHAALQEYAVGQEFKLPAGAGSLL